MEPIYNKGISNRKKLRILVTYYPSDSTKKLANKLLKHISNQHDTTVSKIESQSPSGLDEYDLVIVGSPCHDGDLAVPVKNFLQRLPSNPSFRLAGFCCHATYRTKDSQPRAETMFDESAAKGLVFFRQISVEKNIDLLGVFHCMGVTSPPIMECNHRETILDEKEWFLYNQEASLHPTQADMDELVEFTERIIKETLT